MASEYIGVNGVARKVPTHYIGVDGVARNVKSGYVGVDGVARLFFAPESGGAVVLEVEKITSDTYANETTYTAEEFILLNIYPKTSSSVVKVTYGGLTKTLTFSGSNAQKVFFGTFNGATDSVATPSSGTLTIEGQYSSFAVGTYSTYNTTTSKSSSQYCSCITAATDISGIQTLPSYAFYGCTKLTNVQIPDKITSIGTYAFYKCSNLRLTSLPSGVTSIGSCAFYGCTGITLASLPSGVTSIGSSAFCDCTGITLASLPSGITSIEGGAFYGCTGITLASLPSGVTSIDTSAFYGCTGITLTSLPSGVTSIGSSAFYGCINVKLKTLAGITKIGEGGLHWTGTAANDPLILSEGLTTLGKHALACSGEQNGPKVINIPSTITTIGSQAFYAPSKITGRTVNIYATTPPALEKNTTTGVYLNFHNVDGVTVKVPAGCGAAYKADASWIASGYADRVVEGL